MRINHVLLIAGLLCAGLSNDLVAEPAPDGAPADRLLTDAELVALLDESVFPGAGDIKTRFDNDPDAALQALAAHLREAFAGRYYFDWRKAEQRFADYRERFPEREATHRRLAALHASLYPARARWKLPYLNLQGESVSAYELRHLARQHKVLDMAYVHHYENRDPAQVDYFTEQMRSLNAAFEAGEFEDDAGGNGVYESFRAGYRVLNWLQVHALLLGSGDYDWRDQLELVRTLLHTGAILHEKNRKFRYGNHQTRGAVALALVAIVLRDFAGTETWYDDAMMILGEHLDKEVNPDGFQFERSVHYHVGDIYNYFRVLQLAQLNDFQVPASWRDRLKSMFDAAVVLARPDRRLPVFQDDTDRPWAEFNEMGDFMLLGSLLFDDPVINYFASDTVAPAVYWWLRDEQIAAIASLERRPPALGSAALPDTGYYVMRSGWDPGDHYLAISAGLSEQKPDHQHGDMLGLVARANGQEVLPNYQVRYSLTDFEHFKNSLVKNVAIVDDVLHGRGWKSNRGGSGFGKWEQLPRPTVHAWIPGDGWAFFAGSHDGYSDMGVEYGRSVLAIDGLGWIVRDRFDSSSGPHRFQQVWQGHYSDEGGGNHHRATFDDGSGLEILQLGDLAENWSVDSRRGKGRLVYSLGDESAEYLTLLYPSDSYSDRIPRSFRADGEAALRGWTLRAGTEPGQETLGVRSDARVAIEGDDSAFLLDVRRLDRVGGSVKFDAAVDLLVESAPGGGVLLTVLGQRAVGHEIESGEDAVQSGRLPPGGQVLLDN